LACFFFGAGFRISFSLKGIGELKGHLLFAWTFFYWILLWAVEGASILVMPNAS